MRKKWRKGMRKLSIIDTTGFKGFNQEWANRQRCVGLKYVPPWHILFSACWDFIIYLLTGDRKRREKEDKKACSIFLIGGGRRDYCVKGESRDATPEKEATREERK